MNCGCDLKGSPLADLSTDMCSICREGEEPPDEDNPVFESAHAQQASLSKRLSQLTVPEHPYGLGLKVRPCMVSALSACLCFHCTPTWFWCTHVIPFGA